MEFIKVAAINKPVAVSFIIWIEGRGNYALLHRVEEKPYLASNTLKHFQSQLLSFIRVHKKALVNPQYIDRLAYADRNDAFVLLTNGSKLPVSRRRLKAVARELEILRLPKLSNRVSRIYTPQTGLFVTVPGENKSIVIPRM